jgi:hypothetical protein
MARACACVRLSMGVEGRMARARAARAGVRLSMGVEDARHARVCVCLYGGRGLMARARRAFMVRVFFGAFVGISLKKVFNSP